MLDLKNVQGIKEITTQDENYPRSLREIKDAPEVLYSKGELKAEEKCFAIVGARRCSDYGKQIALEIAGDLAEAGLTIVSGLAPGIDTIAHQATLERKGKTIAVLGTGIDEESIYPQSNLKLAEKILESGGALVSEYPPGTRGTQFTFPQRNRIISGLSLGVLVVEAKQKSGALITADWARKQRRLVFAIPGSIYFSNSKGCNNLIKNGAKLAESADDILKELNLQKSDFCIKKTSGETSEENLILNALKEGALDVDEIIKRTGLSAQRAASLLTILEIKGKIRNLGRNTYAISHR
ncbi:MAG: DNA protecting protein DprA [Parcubacteria group bacterium CG1_02_39_15]|nr:MAG: DNA protecting protein DprA [Parcubacteria group bacterium CG1_02_39_15]